MNQMLFENLKVAADRSVREKAEAGLNILLMKNGEEEAYYETGYADLEACKPIQRDTLFRLYSMSKPITGAAAMILFERGAFDLMDPVAKYLPGFKNRKVLENGKLVPEYRPLNIHDLLSMQSGMPYGSETVAGRYAEKIFLDAARNVDTDKALSTVELCNLLGQGPGEFQPGRKWMYGTGADIMGAVIEVVSGKKLGEFMEDEIFRPLGMKDTGFFVPAEKMPRMAKTYASENGELTEVKTTHLGISREFKTYPAFESGGAGLVSCIDDYKNFALMLANGGELNGKRILKKATVGYFSSNQIYPGNEQSFWDYFDTGRGYGYGNFNRVMLYPGQSYMLGPVGEYGWDGWLGCHFAVAPHENIVFITMKQLYNAGTERITRELRNIAFSHLID